MANSRRTYQWVDGRIQEFRQPYGRAQLLPDTEKPRPFIGLPPKSKVRKPAIGIQDALLLFTMSSVVMVFAGLGLLAFLFAAYSIIFG